MNYLNHTHRFNNINGKCDYCRILGCENGFIAHRFNSINGKCDYCRILGCKIGLI